MAQELYESDYVTQGKRARKKGAWIPWALGGAGLAVLAIIGVALYFFVFTMAVTVDGESVRIPANSTVATLFSQGLVKRRVGDLVSVRDHKVLTVGGGAQPYVLRNGQQLNSDAKLVAGEDLDTHDGANVVEKTRVATESIAIPTQYQGTGPVQTVLSAGSKGVREVTLGVVSHEVVSSREVKPAVARVVDRQPVTPGAKVIALTFDDGPWPGSTLAILKILKDAGIKATFFEIGRQARQNPGLSRAVADAGMEMGNHSESHPLNLGRLSAAAVWNQIVQGQSDVYHASGQAPKFFRPPGGNTTPTMYPPLNKLHLQWIQWDIDTEDWKRPSVQSIVGKVMHNARPGAVVLMHDGGGDRSHTIQALPQIIKGLEAEGYSFVTVDQLTRIPHVMG